AAQAAMAHPRGAVHLALGAGVAAAPAGPVATTVRRAAAAAPASEALDAVADAIARASRPVLVVGLEVAAEDAKWVRALAESLPAPVLTTPKGKGALPDPHPLALGLLAADHALLAQSDLLISLGVDCVELTPRAWPAGVAIVRIARGPQEHAVVADIALVLEELAPRLRGRMRADWDVAALDRLKRAHTASAPRPGLARRRVVEIAREATPAGRGAGRGGAGGGREAAAAWGVAQGGQRGGGDVGRAPRAAGGLLDPRAPPAGPRCAFVAGPPAPRPPFPARHPDTAPQPTG